jgi:hypothetical protein
MMLQLSLLLPASMLLQASHASLLLLESLLLMVSLLLLESMLMMASFSCRSLFSCRMFWYLCYCWRLFYCWRTCCAGVSDAVCDPAVSGVPVVAFVPTELLMSMLYSSLYLCCRWCTCCLFLLFLSSSCEPKWRVAMAQDLTRTFVFLFLTYSILYFLFLSFLNKSSVLSRSSLKISLCREMGLVPTPSVKHGMV